MTTWSWMADAVLAMLLTATLVMAIRLDRALRVVRRDRTSFETLISNLGAATGSVKAGIQALRAEAERAAEQIDRRSVDADKMATDLSFLVEAADRAGARLEQTLQTLVARSGPVSDGATDTATREVQGPAVVLAGAKPAKAAQRRVRRKASPAPATPAPDAEEPAAAVAAPPADDTTADDESRTVVHGDGSLNAELRTLAGITTRRRAPRAEPGTVLIKLVG